MGRANSKIKEVQEALGIPQGTWNDFITDRVITIKDVYDVGEVGKEVIEHQKVKLRKLHGQNTALHAQIKNLEKKIAIMENDMTNNSSTMSNKTKKESLDILINRQKLIKMQHENKVRAKEYMPVDNVFELITSIASEFAAFLDPLPSRIKQLVPGMSARTFDMLSKSIINSRNALSRHIEGHTVTNLIELFNPDTTKLDEDDQEWE